VSLTDIKKRILKEAELESGKITAKASLEQEERLKTAVKELNKHKKDFNENISLKITNVVQQKKLLFKMEAQQQLLQNKRSHIQTLQEDLVAETIADKDLLEKYYVKVLTELRAELTNESQFQVMVSKNNIKLLESILKKIELTAKVVELKDASNGTLEIQLTSAKINCSLKEYVAEKIKMMEIEIAKQLF
jgi:hypothetical protein